IPVIPCTHINHVPVSKNVAILSYNKPRSTAQVGFSRANFSIGRIVQKNFNYAVIVSFGYRNCIYSSFIGLGINPMGNKSEYKKIRQYFTYHLTMLNAKNHNCGLNQKRDYLLEMPASFFVVFFEPLAPLSAVCASSLTAILLSISFFCFVLFCFLSVCLAGAVCCAKAKVTNPANASVAANFTKVFMVIIVL